MKPHLRRGAFPTPRHELAAATPHRTSAELIIPSSFLMWPTHMCPWGNYGYGDCVTAEEAFAKSCAAPKTFFSQPYIIKWARKHGYAQGAYLTTVMKTMQTSGFEKNGQQYYDGKFLSVDWTDPEILASACFTHGPVKLGVAADDLENIVTAGVNGWVGTLPKNHNEDHCVSLCGYGTLGDLADLLYQNGGVKVTPPTTQPVTLSYAIFTWDSIGIIDQQSLLNITSEAWVRTPTTITKEDVGSDTSQKIERPKENIMTRLRRAI